MSMELQRSTDIYSSEFVARLFDEMSQTYGTVNVLSSFGFCIRWRRQCLEQIDLRSAAIIYDLMSGMGELWSGISARNDRAKIIGIDISPRMCERSRQCAARLQRNPIEILQADALNNPLADESADAIVSSFGLKTFSDEQQQRLAEQVFRLLKPGGTFSLLEISVPRNRALRIPYMFYLRILIPLIGWVLLGNPDNYRMLRVYTAAFQDCSRMRQHLENQGLQVSIKPFFFGCATGLVGRKPVN